MGKDVRKYPQIFQVTICETRRFVEGDKRGEGKREVTKGRVFVAKTTQ